MRNSNWEKVGTIGVDAGLCWLGDPCYILDGARPEAVGKNWVEFCKKLEAGEANGTMAWDNGLGVTVSTGAGDGEYEVFVRRSRSGEVAEVKVVFLED